MATGVPRCAVLNASEAASGELGSGESLGGSESEGPSMVVIGVIMGLGASVAINIGQNLQALGLQGVGKAANPCTSRTWVVGMTVFIVGSFVNFAAFSFASSSVLVPLEAVQLIVNVIFNKLVNNAPVSIRMIIGVVLAVLGTCLTVIFGPNDERCFTVAEMEGFWSQPAWWFYLVGTFSFSVFCYVINRKYHHAQLLGTPLPHSQYVAPVTFALSSALVGGAQMIVHSKAIAELFEIIVLKLQHPNLHEPLPLTTWYFYVEFALLSVCGVIWLYRMNESLGLFDPLFIIPLMQSSYILFGVVAGGVYYNEFGTLSNKVMFGVNLGIGGWFFFLGGLACILVGLLLIAPPPQRAATNSLGAEAHLTRLPSAYSGGLPDEFMPPTRDADIERNSTQRRHSQDSRQRICPVHTSTDDSGGISSRQTPRSSDFPMSASPARA
ncbi:hypothetical protein AB1Y20_005826 [Prymnesium parvum]|uniref:Magnesium transporter n=1 Tax=Prymnesium parvum TaxID=97485 RepID=A0AB34J231_PRYPA